MYIYSFSCGKMTERGETMDKRKKFIGITAVICLFAILCVLIGIYFRFVSRMIYEESSQHLTEIYTQINQSLSDTVSEKWRALEFWSRYLQISDSDEDISDFIESRKKQWNFRDFYFISSNGSYRTAEGKSGFIDFKDQMSRLINDGKPVMMDIAFPGSPELQVFAVPSEGGTYKGFEYGAIAIAYDNASMIKNLNVSAFDGLAQSYVVYSTGRVLLDNVGEKEEGVYNFLAFLEKDADMSKEETEKLKTEFQNGGSGISTLRYSGKRYYLIYNPVDFLDGMLIGVVPTDVVNSSMNRLQLVTMSVFISIACAIGTALVLILIRKNKKELMEKETDIKYREELFSNLSDNVDDIFLMLDADGLQINYISPNSEKLLGIKIPETPERDETVQNEILGKQGFGILDYLPQIDAGERREWEHEYIHQITGDVRYFRILAYRSDILGIAKYIVVLSDRTQEHVMNQSLTNAMNLAKSANEAKSNFLANMSHDIRTPMNAIVGLATLLGREADSPEKVQEYTRKIVFSSQHLLGLINDILDMSKIESGHTALNVTEFSLCALIEEIHSIVSSQTKAKKQSLKFRTKGDVPDLVQGDRMRLNQILLNLLSNAVKYTEVGGEIYLTVEALGQRIREHAHLRFTVQDNGYGMSAEFIKNIFDPFSRENTEQKREIKGTGLGMAITKNIVDLMGGTISVESTKGKGSVFSVELEFRTVGEEEDNGFWKYHNLTRLLVADDEEDVCCNIKELMSGTGVTVSCAADGAQAVKLASEAFDSGLSFDIILLDWKMPEMDGIEAARRIRKKVGRDVPIMVLTAYDFSDIEEEAGKAGVDLFLPKPFFVSNFRRVVSQYYSRNTEDSLKKKEPEALRPGINILVVDDNELNAEIISGLLNTEGVLCEAVGSGIKAIERFENAEPDEFDLIFMDIQMPDMDGYEATRKIRACKNANAASVPIIALTANAFDTDVQKAFDAGMNAHMSKPVDMKKLRQVIRRFVK